MKRASLKWIVSCVGVVASGASGSLLEMVSENRYVDARVSAGATVDDPPPVHPSSFMAPFDGVVNATAVSGARTGTVSVRQTSGFVQDGFSVSLSRVIGNATGSGSTTIVAFGTSVFDVQFDLTETARVAFVSQITSAGIELVLQDASGNILAEGSGEFQERLSAGRYRVRAVVTATFTYPGSLIGGFGVSSTLSCQATPIALPMCTADINGDGLTGVSDFNILASQFGQSVPPNVHGDLNGDGTVGIADFNILAGDFGCAGG